VSNLWSFLSDMEKKFQAWTIVNYSAAMQWHLVYLHYLLHPETVPVDDKEKEVHKSFCPKASGEVKKLKKEMKEGMGKLCSLIGKTSEVAECQTRMRNSKEALLQAGCWVEMDWMMKLKAVINEEGWAQLSSLKQRIELIGLESLLQVNIYFPHFVFIIC
jgi:hypothetical protein